MQRATTTKTGRGSTSLICASESLIASSPRWSLGARAEQAEPTLCSNALKQCLDYLQAVKVIARIIRWYDEERLHSALGFLRPVDYYRGNPEEKYAERRRKLAEARHRRREKNLQLRQPTLPLTSEEPVA